MSSAVTECDFKSCGSDVNIDTFNYNLSVETFGNNTISTWVLNKASKLNIINTLTDQLKKIFEKDISSAKINKIINELIVFTGSDKNDEMDVNANRFKLKLTKIKGGTEIALGEYEEDWFVIDEKGIIHSLFFESDDGDDTTKCIIVFKSSPSKYNQGALDYVCRFESDSD
jgi:hypothetical protein